MVFPILPVNTLSGGYNIANSLRSNQPDGAYLSFAVSSPNTDIFTISMWVKPSLVLSGSATFFEIGKALTGEAGDYTTFQAHFDGYTDHGGRSQFDSYDGVANGYKIRWGAPGSYKIRDPSAWFHIVMRMDSSQNTLANRARFYINGEDISSRLTKTVDPSQNDDYFHATGSSVYFPGGVSSTAGKWNGHIAECAYIDGTSYAASTFAETDEDSGIWKPKDFKDDVTFGTNGLYLEFKQSGTGTNSSGLGADTSGNDNHMAVTNFAATDQTTDSPTNNWCTLNPISEHNDSAFSDGNLTYTGSASAVHQAIGSIGVTQGKWYYEAKRVTGNSAYPFMGVFNADGTMGGYLGDTVDGWSILMEGGDSGEWRNDGTLSGTSVGAFADDDIGMVAIDMDNGKIWFGRNGTWGDSGDPSAGSGEQYSNLTGTIIPAVAVYTGAAISLNFGNPSFSISSGNADARGYGNFEYAVPSGFYALCTKNLAIYG